MSELLTAELKSMAYGLGADLVGVGNIERWKNCPPLMSPAGILPTARSVLVCGMHHTDAMIEIGGENSPHEQGSYVYQMLMNMHLDVMSYEIGRRLEDLGYRTVPICSSNIWRYREYKDLKSTFSPDMSHIYASIAAGLTELGYSGIAMSPEYGPRNRFVSIITEAPLVPSPLLPGNTVCDRCMLCVKNCPTEAFTRESKGEVSIEIEGRRYTRCDKSLWRCSWGEHFGLDVELPKPELVDEAAILRNVETVGLRGGTMGNCIKVCVPKDRRVFDKSYCSGPRRRKEISPASEAPLRPLQDRFTAEMLADGADSVVVQTRQAWLDRGVDLRQLLPDAESVVSFAVTHPRASAAAKAGNPVDWGGPAHYLGLKVAFFTARALEKAGYCAAPYAVYGFSGEGKALLSKLGDEVSRSVDGVPHEATFVVTSAKLEPGSRRAEAVPLPEGRDAGKAVRGLARGLGVDLVGISGTDRFESLRKDLTRFFDGEELLDARETGKRWLTSSADVTAYKRRVLMPQDHLNGARSVIVLGYRIPAASVERNCEPPAEAIGPYAFAAYQSRKSLDLAAMKLMKAMAGWGAKTAATWDLCGTGSYAANPRGPQANAFSNRIAAVCAGLGTLTKGGFVNTPEFGPNVRFVAIVTDMELAPDALADLAGLRAECDEGCDRCVGHCTVSAFKDPVKLKIGKTALSFHPVEQVRCDWALRYGLVPEEGVKYTGSKSSAPLPETVTAEALADGMKRQDTILKIRPCVSEMCMMACPYVRSQR